MKSPFNRRSLCGRQLNFKFTSLNIETVEAIFLFPNAFPEGASTCAPEVHGIYQQASSARQSNCGTSAIFEGLFANTILMTSSNSQKWIWTGLSNNLNQRFARVDSGQPSISGQYWPFPTASTSFYHPSEPCTHTYQATNQFAARIVPCRTVTNSTCSEHAIAFFCCIQWFWCDECHC